MKIGNPEALASVNGVGNGRTAATGTPAAPQKADGAKPADASAQVALSPTASELLGSGAAADIDMEKVERISKAIEDGTFKVNPEVIADKLIANAQELLGKVTK